MHVAYVTVGKADDVHEWSGLNAAIRRSIEAQGCTVSNVDQLGASYPLTMRLRSRVARMLGATYALERSPYAASRWSRVASEKLAQLRSVNVIVSTGTTAVSRLLPTLPLALWSDATFHSLRTTYPEYANYSRASIDEGDRLERAALDRARLICYASKWAAADAVDYYGIHRDKIRVVEFGANFESPFLDEADVVSAVRCRDWATVRFTFLGVDWHRKGGEVAVDIVRRLNETGTKAVLAVVGCRPPADIERLPYVECAGFLSKKVAADRQQLHALLQRSHFLLLPTIAECFGLVFAEASAHAVPSISRAVGGVPSAVSHGHTGLLLPRDASPADFCEALAPLLTRRTQYMAMCIAAYRDYQARLNWRVAGSRFVAEIRATLHRGSIAS